MEVLIDKKLIKNNGLLLMRKVHSSTNVDEFVKLISEIMDFDWKIKDDKLYIVPKDDTEYWFAGFLDWSVENEI